MKIKKTLIVSSFILALVLVVTIVSVSAAWFGDTLSLSDEITVNTKNAEAKIVIKTDSTSSSGETLAPAKMTNGYMLTHQINGQTIDVRSQANVTNGILTRTAQKVDIWFPVYGIGETDQAGRLPSMISISGVYIQNDSTLVNYLDDFIIELAVATADKSQTNIASVATPNDLTVGGSNIYWKYNSTSNKIGLLIQQGVYYYIRMSVYFGKVDEELPPELLDTLVRVDLSIGTSTRAIIEAL